MAPQSVGSVGGFLQQWREQLNRKGLAAAESADEMAPLACLPKETPVHQFGGSIAQVEAAADTVENGGFCVLTNVPKRFLNSSKLEQASIGRIRYYSSELNVLLLKMPSGPHETVGSWFDRVIDHKLHAMGMRPSVWLSFSRAETFKIDGGKEADCTYSPKQMPTKWPTLVIETGYSESHAFLANDAKRWVEKSSGRLKGVITVRVSKTLITINRYGASQQQTRGPHRAVHRQRITMRRNQQGIHISQAPLVIPFRDLFLQDPTGTRGDLLFNQADLEDLATEVWDDFDFPRQ